MINSIQHMKSYIWLENRLSPDGSLCRSILARERWINEGVSSLLTAT
jgi:hypothetical protein